MALWHQTAMDHTQSLVPFSTNNVLSSSKKSPGFSILLFRIYISRNDISAPWPSLRFTGRVKQIVQNLKRLGDKKIYYIVIIIYNR